MTCTTTKQRHSRIPERQQLTRLQAYIVASSLWPWLGRPLLRRRYPSLPASNDQDSMAPTTALPNNKIELGEGEYPQAADIP